MIKICQNVLWQKEFEPEPRLVKRQKYCHKCAQLPVKNRRRTAPIKDMVCDNPACGKTFTPRSNLLGRQRYCRTFCRKEHNLLKSKKHASRNVRTTTPYIPAICPRCGEPHTLALLWSGTLPARKFCPTCEEYRKSELMSGLMFDHVFQSSF